MTDRNLQILASPGFLIGLVLLLSNDLVFKEQFHNGFTGKLSDFAGLFVFSLFWIAFFPRYKTLICVSTAVLFVFWKSSYSQFLIEGWNSFPFFGIQRAVDHSDLWALLVLPLSYFYCNISFAVHVPHRFIYVIALISLVAFTATSYRHDASFNNEYQFQSSRTELLERMSRLSMNDVHGSFWEGNEFEITFDSCNGSAKISFEERENYSVIRLNEMEYRCPVKPTQHAMRQYFEKEFIDKIREEPVSKSAQVQSIWSIPTGASNTSSP
jgi:hypothetical protein